MGTKINSEGWIIDPVAGRYPSQMGGSQIRLTVEDPNKTHQGWSSAFHDVGDPFEVGLVEAQVQAFVF